LAGPVRRGSDRAVVNRPYVCTLESEAGPGIRSDAHLRADGAQRRRCCSKGCAKSNTDTWDATLHWQCEARM